MVELRVAHPHSGMLFGLEKKGHPVTGHLGGPGRLGAERPACHQRTNPIGLLFREVPRVPEFTETAGRAVGARGRGDWVTAGQECG